MIEASGAADEPLGADDLLPLLCYVTLLAAPPCLESEIRMMEDFMPEAPQLLDSVECHSQTYQTNRISLHPAGCNCVA